MWYSDIKLQIHLSDLLPFAPCGQYHISLATWEVITGTVRQPGEEEKEEKNLSALI